MKMPDALDSITPEQAAEFLRGKKPKTLSEKLREERAAKLERRIDKGYKPAGVKPIGKHTTARENAAFGKFKKNKRKARQMRQGRPI